MRNDARDREVWRLYSEEGLTQAEVGKRVGLTQQRVSGIILRQRGHLPIPSRDELRRSLVNQLEHIRERMQEIVDMPGAPVVKTLGGGDGEGSNLVVVRDPENDDSVVRDYSGQIKAAAEIVRAHQRLSALAGLDEPARVETSGTVRYEIAGLNPSDLK